MFGGIWDGVFVEGRWDNAFLKGKKERDKKMAY